MDKVARLPQETSQAEGKDIVWQAQPVVTISVNDGAQWSSSSPERQLTGQKKLVKPTEKSRSSI